MLRRWQCSSTRRWSIDGRSWSTEVALGCGGTGAGVSARNGSGNGGCGVGGAKRSACAYGIPRARVTSPSTTASIVPAGESKERVSVVGTDPR